MNRLNHLVTTTKNLYKEHKKTQIDNDIFKNQYDFDKRLNQSIHIRKEYPNRIPIIVERYNKSLPKIDRKKYLAPEDLSMVNFLYLIRKRLHLKPEKSFFLFVDEKIIPMSNILMNVYERHKDIDGFLYMKYCEENTFG